MENRDLNRLKVVLAEKNGLTVGWLRSFFDMTKSCALYFLCLCIRQYLPTQKKDEGNLRRHTLVYGY